MHDDRTPADQPEHDPWAGLTAPEEPAVAISIGNTTARLGLIRGFAVASTRAVPAADAEAVAAATAELAAAAEAPTALVASVNTSASSKLVDRLRAAGGPAPLPFGPAMPVPMPTDVPEPQSVGQDRLLAALGAFHALKQACIVVDAGTALTVDFIDGHGVFQGGAIAPGAQLMLDALRDHTDALPGTSLADMPEPLEPYAKSTEHAMLLGVRGAVRGAIRYLAEQYAEHYEAYPSIIATGGDAEALLRGDELIDTIAPDLLLLGIAVARARLAHEPDQA
ncbi:MAG: type III pantothenate kinase [Planctomycetota bacterium]